MDFKTLEKVWDVVVRNDLKMEKSGREGRDDFRS